jgi:hypothetical protein
MDLPIPALLVLLSTSVSLSAQWLGYPTPGIPRTADGKPSLSAPAPRTPDGKPDLSGIWAVHTTSSAISRAVDPKAGPLPFDLGGTSNLPYRPGVAEKVLRCGPLMATLTMPRRAGMLPRCLPSLSNT